ncbi:C-GCAxxG-C-C family protein [Anaeromyxobacter diazotrophicus]|uniref:Tat pathway signal protein n=1 Tax=Anaeromyxobacter diazotrophicus TaxID=2590199 RepID=A0A7I9VJC2_9BACT|nr:C-GCAxxG-C-C family protein [Anaeromyxobacter diazotrophicus]GEJ56512.1 Tat pathway signal protein [Anaeromyxobacter diazotrophicus]
MSKQANGVVSRRAFLTGAGGAAAAAAGLVALGLPAAAEAQAAPSVPWPLPVLNPDVARDAGYFGYWTNDPWKNTNYGCAYGVASALLASIRSALGPGSPWDGLPLEMFKWGKTGCVESGTLCGALAGALPIFSLAAPASVVEMGGDLLRWYQETPLPSMEMDWLDPKRRYPQQAQSVSGSPLCHISVSSWCKVSGKLSGSTDRKARCGKITGDVAKMAAIILNRFGSSSKYVPIYAAQPDLYAECVHCHIDAPPPPTPDGVRLNNSLGISNCKTCHPDAAPVMSKK